MEMLFSKFREIFPLLLEKISRTKKIFCSTTEDFFVRLENFYFSKKGMNRGGSSSIDFQGLFVKISPCHRQKQNPTCPSD
jgi:hypothetical protein